MISVSEAREMVIANAGEGSTERVGVREAPGRVLREPIRAREDIPPFDNSAMDGYAVVSDDLSSVPAELKIVLDIEAGTPAGSPIEEGSCAKIMTGAPIPAGADAVVPVEWTNGFHDVGGQVVVRRMPAKGQNIRRAGEDVVAGTTIFEAGSTVRSSMVGTLASLGYDQLTVAVRPTVSIVATGSELVAVGEPLGPGRIRNSNGPALTALAESAGATVIHELVARDDFDETLAALERAAEADIILVSGGVSVGSRDFVKEALDRLGARLLFWRVRQRPGKPLTFGSMSRSLVFGLPGNPVSSTVCFYQYVFPAIACMLGSSTDRVLRAALLSGTLRKAPGLHHFIAGMTSTDDDGHLCVSPSGPQGSHVYSSIAKGDCLIHLEESLESPPPIGSVVKIEPFPC